MKRIHNNHITKTALVLIFFILPAYCSPPPITYGTSPLMHLGIGTAALSGIAALYYAAQVHVLSSKSYKANDENERQRRIASHSTKRNNCACVFGIASAGCLLLKLVGSRSE